MSTHVLRALLVIAALGAGLLGASGQARAGSCEEPDTSNTVRAFERRAKAAGAQVEADPICLESLTPRQVARVVKACGAILTREATFAPCIEWGVRFDQKVLGGVDLFAAVGQAFPLDVFQYGNLTFDLYALLGDARATPIALTAWRAAAADARAGHKRHAHVWGVWRRTVVDLLARVGGGPERTFLIEQQAATKAPGLRRAITRAIAAIDKRVPR
ncbi:MAG: hypothetical protein KBG28_03325 [Kofleriaceae bacterium]|jgi:hypothetical protein|nr:hypothetical protein [Kofleriaceae bacterium]